MMAGPIIFDVTSLNYNDTDFNESYYDENNAMCCGVVCEQHNSMAFEAVFIPILYSVAVVVGLPGNGLVLAVLCQKRRSWSVTDIFVLHLSVADLLLLFTMPLWAVDAAQGWRFGTGLCKLAGGVFQINFYCGIFLLACISLDRYVSVVHAMQMYSRKRPWLVQLSCLGVWLFCLFLSIPEMYFLEAVSDPRRAGKTQCRHPDPTEPWLEISRWLYHILGFLIPACILLYCYTCIILRLLLGSQGAQKQRAVRVVFALVLVFFICWTPYNVVLLVDTAYTNNSSIAMSCETGTALDIALMATSSLGYLHCCMNPVLYAFVGIKFRRHLLEIIKPLRYRVMSRRESSARKSSMMSMDTSQTSGF